MANRDGTGPDGKGAGTGMGHCNDNKDTVSPPVCRKGKKGRRGQGCKWDKIDEDKNSN